MSIRTMSVRIDIKTMFVDEKETVGGDDDVMGAGAHDRLIDDG